jgi:hypothetical protein
MDVTFRSDAGYLWLDGVMAQEVTASGAAGTWPSFETGETAPTTYYDSRVINRDRMNAWVGRFAEIYANNITAGTISSSDGSTYFDLDGDEFRMEHPASTGVTTQLPLTRDESVISASGFTREMELEGQLYNRFIDNWDGNTKMGDLHALMVTKPGWDLTSEPRIGGYIDGSGFVGRVSLPKDQEWVSMTYVQGQLSWINTVTDEVKMSPFPNNQALPTPAYRGGTTYWSEGELYLEPINQNSTHRIYDVHLVYYIRDQNDVNWSGPVLTLLPSFQKGWFEY